MSSREPPPDWAGETGYLDASILARHLPGGFRRFQFFACGSNPVLAAVEAVLVNIVAPADRFHTERFYWV